MELNFDFDNPQPNQEHIEAEVVETTPFDQFDLKTVEKEDSFLVVKQKITAMESKANELKVIDDATFKTGMEMLVQLKALEKVADNFKKNHSLFKKIAQFKNGFDKLIRENVKNKTQKIRDLISPKIGTYQKTQAEIERRVAAKKAEEDAKTAKANAEKDAKALREKEEKEKQEAIDLQAKLNLEADNSGVERVSVPIPEVSEVAPFIPAEVVVTPKSEKVVADQGTAKIESVWIVRVVEPDKVGRKFCSPDQAKLNLAVEAGIRELYGCVIEESFDPKVRLSNKKKDLDFEFLNTK